MAKVDAFGALGTLKSGNQDYLYYRLGVVPGLEKLPYALKVLAENLLRNLDGENITVDHVLALANWNPKATPDTEIQFTPARVVLQDFTGVPCVVDLAVMREAFANMGGDPKVINPQVPSELVIDHSVQIDNYGSDLAFGLNVEREYERNQERYQFLRWGQNAFDTFRVVPPGTGIVHQVNLEYLARGIFTRKTSDGTLAYPDSCVGTDSHTTMVNGLGVLGWGVGGIEAEAAMLGQPISMLIPQVVGFKLTGEIPSGATATDVVLTITQMLREKGVVGKIVEFTGDGISNMPLANRSTIGNMSPEFGSTAAIFPIDDITLDYLRLTGRSAETVELVETYAKAQGLWHNPEAKVAYSDYLELDLSTVVPSIAGPKRPQDRIDLSNSKTAFRQALQNYASTAQADRTDQDGRPHQFATIDIDGKATEIDHGIVAIASITSCTNTSNPSVMMAAGLLARKAAALGLKAKPWVKTSLAPGSQVVTDYFKKADLLKDLEALGFHLVGYGCTTCIGNSGPLPIAVSQAINENDLAVVSVLSGNRNFEGRINPDVKMNYLASPPLVVAYALAGTMDFDFDSQPLGQDLHGNDVFLRDIWPDPAEVQTLIDSSISRDMFQKDYQDVFSGDEHWNLLEVPTGDIFTWNPDSTYVRRATYFEGMTAQPEPVQNILGARVLLRLGDSVTTDHISPAGSFKEDSPAGQYLLAHGVERKDFNSYGSRRGNHEVMVRGTFANIRIRNELVPGVEGGFTKNFTKAGEPVETVFAASQDYLAAGIPTIVLAGAEYGSGSSRDWAAKGPSLLGVKAVIAESFERIHRSNLVGMGILPLEFPAGENRDSLKLEGTEIFDIHGVDAINQGITPETVQVMATKQDGTKVEFNARVRIDTPAERDYYRNGGILQYVLRSLKEAENA